MKKYILASLFILLTSAAFSQWNPKTFVNLAVSDLNGDGVNDEFCLKGWGECATTFYIAIYDRWGEKVFDSEDPDFCWDGKYLGVVMNTAVFVYYIKAEMINAGSITKKGNITLLK